jgi:hypothetical protein
MFLAAICAVARLALPIAVDTYLLSLVLTLTGLSAVWARTTSHTGLIHHREQFF